MIALVELAGYQIIHDIVTPYGFCFIRMSTTISRVERIACHDLLIIVLMTSQRQQETRILASPIQRLKSRWSKIRITFIE